MRKFQALTEEEKAEIISLKQKGYQVNDIARKTKHSTTTVYNVIRMDRESAIPKEEKDPLMILPREIQAFKESVKVGDKFRVYREVIDLYGCKSNEYITETVIGVYPYIVDCTSGSYRYTDLMHCKRIYGGD